MTFKSKPYPKKPVFPDPPTSFGFKTSLEGIEVKPEAQKGRGAVSSQRSGRFERYTHHQTDDGWQGLVEEDEVFVSKLQTTLSIDTAKSVIRYNESPDIGFGRSINPYRGCEHGCIYCFARPSHAYLGLSPGLDFETKLFYKADAAKLLRAEFSKPSYKPEQILIGINTDCYQPSERKLEITRSILQVMAECNHPCSIITKSALILRDLDILAPMAAKNLVRVAVTLGTLDAELHRKLEPRAPRPDKRLATMKALSEAGIPVTIMTAPIIPALNDHEIEDLLQAAKDVGVTHAGFVVLRLPWELKELFEEWLYAHFPGKASHVLSLLRQIYGGKLYDATWEVRGRGTGPYAQMIAQRHRLACEKLGMNKTEKSWDKSLFRKPVGHPDQMELF